jgi:drug/metabolite transporter (DMT)-like permease
MQSRTRARWALPAFAVVVGGAMLAAEAAGGDPRGGAVALGVMCAFAALLAFGGGSETVRVLRGDHDERTALIDLRATAFTGLVLVVAIIAAFLVEAARGHSGNPYAALGALAGASYIAALLVLQRRS